MRLQFHTTEEPTVDLTSLIDVVFLLLIFFMVSTTFERQAFMKVDLPEASEVEDRTDLPESLELVIDSEGRMYLNDMRLIDSTEKTIRAAIEQAAGEDRSLPLILRAWLRRWMLPRNLDSRTSRSPRTGLTDQSNDRPG
jgi:biopolymer transport protein ExbD